MCNLKKYLPQEFQWSLTWFPSPFTSFNIDLKCLILSTLLKEIPNLHYSLIQKGKSDCLKFSAFVPNLFILLYSDALVFYTQLSLVFKSLARYFEDISSTIL